MPDLSPELNLALPVGGDDTREYLVAASSSLRTSLLVVDGLFNAATGHTHNGSHQGGHLAFQDLAVGNNLSVTGASDLHGSVHAYSNLQVDGALTVSGISTLNGNTVLGGNLQVTGTATLSGNVNVGQTLAVGVDVSATRNVSAGGDVYAHGWLYCQTMNQGVYNSAASAGIAFDTGGPTVYGAYGGGHLITENAAQTLTNKTLNSAVLNSPSIGSASLSSSTLINPTLNGTVSGTPAWASAQGFPQGTRIGGLLGVVSRSSDWVVDGGLATVNSIGSGGSMTQGINFNAAFGAPPKVVCTIQNWSGGIGTIGQMQWEVQSVTNNGFTIAIYNVSGATQNCQVSWMAIGA